MYLVQKADHIIESLLRESISAGFYWLTPEGRMESVRSHWEGAEKLTGKTFSDLGTAYGQMHMLGYARVVVTPGFGETPAVIHVEHRNMELTRAQRRELYDLSIETPALVHDDTTQRTIFDPDTA